MFKGRFGRAVVLPPEKLPQLHSIVDVLAGGRPSRQVMVESITSKEIVTKDCIGRVGEPAVIVYGAVAGRFRAETKIVAASATSTRFAMPRKLSAIALPRGGQKRSSVRLDTLVSGAWRLAPKGTGVGPFARATIRDISRGGCSLICERELRIGAEVEVELELQPGGGPPLAMISEVMRHEHLERSGKHCYGLRFTSVTAAADHAIVEFINRKQTDLRNRGLA